MSQATDPRSNGVDPSRLDEDDLLRELNHLYTTRMDTLRHGSDNAFSEHTRRMNQYEAEYLRRKPAREIDPERLRAGARAR
ncbi:DUF6158 family protein [Actinomadura gamaensis]|uniref:DUF6158 family protein n=1 Tax=Actinomadura gamaensis TaxID=1763541 RepID=A0ABV9U3N5_9ACTN